MLNLFKPYKTKSFKSADDAFAAIVEIYNGNVQGLREAFRLFAAGQLKESNVRAYYPFLRFKSVTSGRPDTRLSYGFVSKPGVYETTVTRPDIFDVYYKTMIGHLLKNHGGAVEVGLSEIPIPLHFALGEDFHLERDLTHAQMEILPNIFDQPDLTLMDDTIANGTHFVKPGEAFPLALFSASRVDLSLMRLKHYTGTKAAHFQNYVLFTNYQFYIDEFIKIATDMMAETSDPTLRLQREQYTAFVEPGDKVTANKNIPSDARKDRDEAGAMLRRMPQMPAYHLKRADGSGITMVNIGVGPSNAKTITDHVAVLRPHAWLMLGHCAGLRNSQSLGDYVLAHGYLREDNVLFHDLHPSIPLPALSEIQVSLE